jgi:ATP-binding cassette, subfamily B, bacterial MsbA
MKKYSRVFAYFKNYKGSIVLYVVCMLLSIVFSIVSVGMLMPFLDLIFKGDSNTSFLSDSKNPVIKWVNNFLTNSINTRGKIH